MIMTPAKTNNFINKILEKYNNEVTQIYICTKDRNIGDFVQFTTVEMYVEFTKETEITIEIQEVLASLMEEDTNMVFCAYPYEGILPNNTEVTIWKKN